MTSQEFIESIQKVENVNEHYRFIDSLVNKDNEKIISIFDLIPKDWNYLLNHWQLRAGYENIISNVCINNNPSSISLASTLFEKIERHLDKLRIASMLSTTHKQEILLERLLESDNQELLNLIVHELISRGNDLRISNYFKEIETLNNNSHFKLLSLYPLPQEKENTFPSYSSNGSGYGFNYGFASSDEYSKIIENLNETILINKDEEIVEAIDHWTKDSNGLSIGYKGEIKIDSSIDSIIKSIPELKNSNKIRIKKLDSSMAFRVLFDASSKGAAYSYGNYGAYGRLKTWKSIHRLISDLPFESNEETSKIMIENNWFEFNTDEWFINEWCDFGLISINPNTLKFGLISGTDTD